MVLAPNPKLKKVKGRHACQAGPAGPPGLDGRLDYSTKQSRTTLLAHSTGTASTAGWPVRLSQLPDCLGRLAPLDVPTVPNDTVSPDGQPAHLTRPE